MSPNTVMIAVIVDGRHVADLSVDRDGSATEAASLARAHPEVPNVCNPLRWAVNFVPGVSISFDRVKP